MKLIYAEIENFKSLKEFKAEFRNNKILIIGKNNTGKSNLLQFLGLLFKPGSISYDLPSFNREWNKPEMYFDETKEISAHLVFSFGNSAELVPEEVRDYIEEKSGEFVVRITFKKMRGSDGYFYIGSTNVGSPEYVKTARYIYFNSIILDASRNYNHTMRTLGNSSIYSVLFSKIVYYLARISSAEILARSAFSEEDFDQYFIKLLEKFFVDNHFIDRTIVDFKEINFICERSIKNAILNISKNIDPMGNAETAVSSLIALVNDGKQQPLHLKGMGVQSLFLVSLISRVNEFFPIPPLLCIDEAELHLHPQAQRRLNDVLDELANTAQLIVTTHSPILLSNVDLRDVILLKKETATTGFQLSADCGLSQDVIKRELNEYTAEMLFADAVILVEGLSERIVLRHIANNCLEKKYNVDKNNISIIPVGGKENIQFYCQLLDSFRIPNVCMIDKDGLDSALAILKCKEIDIPSGSSEEKLIALAKTNNIFVLKKGELENYYPKDLVQTLYGRDDFEKKWTDSLKKKVEGDSLFQIVLQVICSNVPISRPSTDYELGRLKKNVKKWYDVALSGLSKAGKLTDRKKKQYEVLEGIFGPIGKPRLAMKISHAMIEGRHVDEELINIIRIATELSNQTKLDVF